VTSATTVNRSVAANADAALVPLPSIGVYVHIPFCSSRCRYCDFHFETTRSRHLMAQVLDGIAREAESLLPRLGHPRIRSVYFGGGTPSILAPDLLAGFLPRFRRALRLGDAGAVEWSFESNPESTTEELLSVLSKNGVNRLSVGVQSFQNRLLQALGRRADRETALRALDCAAGFAHCIPHLNVDLMTGIPGQTAADVREDTRIVLEHAPDHVSLYSLTLEERTPLAQAVGIRPQLLLPASEQERLWLSAQRMLERSGYEWYEVSNFARTESGRSAHNCSYWKLEPYLGLGPGAVSTLPVTTGRVQPARIRNPGLFLYRPGATDVPSRRETELLSPRDFLLEHFITGLRTADGLSLDHIRAVFGGDSVKELEPLFRRWAEAGVADRRSFREADRLLLVPKERLRLDRHLLTVAERLDSMSLPESIDWP